MSRQLALSQQKVEGRVWDVLRSGTVKHELHGMDARIEETVWNACEEASGQARHGWLDCCTDCKGMSCRFRSERLAIGRGFVVAWLAKRMGRSRA